MITQSRLIQLRTGCQRAPVYTAPAQIRVAGEDRVRLLNNLCTNDLARLPTGAGKETFFCNAKGGVLFYATVWNLDDAFWVEIEHARGTAFVQHVDRYIIREKVTPTDATPDLFAARFVGSAAALEISQLLGVEPLGTMQIMAGQITDESGEVVRMQVRRVDRAGATILDVVGPKSAEIAFEKSIKRISLAALPVSDQELDALRILDGTPAAGVEVVEGLLPQELDRTEQAISFTKGCYIGQETVARLDAYGHVNKVLRGVAFLGSLEIPRGSPLRSGEKEVGVLQSSAVFEFETGSGSIIQTLGLAVIRASIPTHQPTSDGKTESSEGSVTLQLEGAASVGTVHALPFPQATNR